MLDLDWVTDRLAVGATFPTDAAERLAGALGIRHVVDVRVEACDDVQVLRACGITFLHLPTEDRCAVAQDALDEGVAWVRRRLARGEKVYVHCQHGIGRSALLACCVLVAEGLEPVEALAAAKRARAKVSPSPEQLRAFVEWCRRWRARAGAAWSVPSFEALAAVAYSHLREAAPGA